MKLKIFTGDITKINCDAIVCPVNERMEYADTIGGAIRNATGQVYLKQNILVFEAGYCVVTAADNIPCEHIIHTVFPRLSAFTFSERTDSDTTISKLSKCYKSAVSKAVAEKYRFVAIPLLGAWDPYLPLEKAFEIAVNEIKTSVGDECDITVYLVITDEQYAYLQKHFNSKKASTAEQASNAVMEQEYPLDKRWISLCKVNKRDRNRDIWLLRLADVIDGSLVATVIDDRKDQIFDNRRLVFRENGPNAVDHLGFWEWTERKTDSGRWWSNATYLEETSPIEIIVLNDLNSVEQIVDTLKAGMRVPAYIAEKILFAVNQNYSLEGLLCDLSDFDICDGEEQFITLKDSVHMLPCYELKESDIFTWNDRRVYKHISLGEPKKRIMTPVPVQMLKQLFLQRMSWPVFKAQGIVKSDWQKIKQFFSEIPDNTLLETVSQAYGMSVQEAQDCVDAFLQTVEAHVDVADVDSALIIQMLDHHEGLKQKTDSIAQEKWKEEHRAEVEQAQAEIADMRKAAEQDIAAVKQRSAEVEKSVADAETKHKCILSEIEASESKLNQLIADIEQYETLGNDTMEAVRGKIAEAQKDMAGFIADLSAVLPQSHNVVVEKSANYWKYETAVEPGQNEEEADISETWTEEFAQLSDNLSHVFGINNELCNLLAAFLYAANIHNMSILVAGPGGKELAEVLSRTIYATGSGHVTLGNEYDPDIVDGVEKYREDIVSIHNLFHKGWADTLPQIFSDTGKHVIWSTPYAEDITLEPRGLFNYALPLLSECFIESMPKNSTGLRNRAWKAKRSTEFSAYTPGKKLPLKLGCWKLLKLSKLLLNKMERILTDVKRIVERESSYKDIEVLLGVLPLAVLTGKTDILSDLLENEKGISSAVRAEVLRYIEEE